MVKLPKSMIQERISDLEIDKSAYTVPRALIPKKTRFCYIDQDKHISNEKTDDYCLKITRHKTGFVVYIGDIKHQWQDDIYDQIDISEIRYQPVISFGAKETLKNPEVKIEELESLKEIAIEEQDYENARKYDNEIKEVQLKLLLAENK